MKQQITRLLLSSGLAILALSACTKEIPYEEKLKVEVLDRSSFDTGSDYLMSSSMLNASRSSTEALPFSMGDNKRIRFEWSKTSLRVVEMEKDQRFKGNETNNKLVLEIPVDYVDYQCSKDKYGECTNSEEERSDVSWEQKTKFKFRPEAAKSARLEILPILLDNELSGGFCYDEVSSRVVDLKLEKDAFNMAIERTFRLNAYCLETNDLADSTVSAVFHYSFVKASSVLSKDFKTVQYPSGDEDAFGFFKTESQELDTDNNTSVNGERSIMNHWNPNRSEITYLLSDEFKKPEHAKIRQLTEQVVGSLNSGLAQAGAKFRINLKDAEGKSPGDIRNSMIVLVEDPVASSIIGYGPQTEDPVTGEIISARTVMFLGTIKKYIKYTYDDILREKKAIQLEKLRAAQQPAPGGDQNTGEDNGGLVIEDALKARLAQGLFKSQNLHDLATYKAPTSTVSTGGETSVVEGAKIKRIEKELHTSRAQRNMDYEGGAQAHLKYLQEAKNCAYGLNADLASASISGRLIDAFADDAKPWEQLSASEQQKVIDIILPEIWVPTLIHEMGHNLGLRHNFKGSEDPKNFYTPEELQKLGIDHEIPFSTVMEYGDDLKALPVLGKYDIAALKFAYAQKVELADGKVVPVKNTIEETLKEESDKAGSEVSLKEYGYCSDEHTGINAGCRRFDLGVTLTEIVENEIKNYKNAYERRNKRAGRSSFSVVDDIAYAGRIRSVFQGLRLMQESYESIKHRFGIPDGHKIWETNAFLKDLKTASTKSGQFLMSVIATPDLTCALVDIRNPGVLVQVIRLDDLDASQMSCFELNMADFGAPNLAVAGQYGRLFQSRKDPKDTKHPYADQIDVRGYWIDKLIASRMLFARDLGISILDKETDNFTDRPDLAPAVADLTKAMLLNKVTGEQDLELASGEILRMDLPVDSKVQVQKPLFSGLARVLGIPNETVSFSQVLVDTIAQREVNKDHVLEGNAFMDTLRVGRTYLGDRWSADHQMLDISDVRFMASSKNTLARTAMDQHRMSSSMQAVEKRDIKDDQNNVIKTGRDRLKELRDILKAKGQKPLPMTDDEKDVWKLGEEKITDYLNGDLEQPEFFKELLLILPAASKN